MNESAHHIVPRDKEKDLKFRGRLLATVNNRVEGISKRWREYRLYQTDGGTFVCHRIGRTSVPGEVDRNAATLVPPDGSDGYEHDIAAGKTGPLRHFTANEMIVQCFGLTSLAKRLYALVGIDVSEDIR